jgi:hypothetical protein
MRRHNWSWTISLSQVVAAVVQFTIQARAVLVDTEIALRVKQLAAAVRQKVHCLSTWARVIP